MCCIVLKCFYLCSVIGSNERQTSKGIPDKTQEMLNQKQPTQSIAMNKLFFAKFFATPSFPLATGRGGRGEVKTVSHEY